MATSSRSKKPPSGTIQLAMQDPSSGAMRLDTFAVFPGKDPFTGLGGKALHDAQQKAYDAMQAPSATQQQKLAKEALALSLDCSDAYTILAEHTSSVDEAIHLCEEGVKAGERVLGKHNLTTYQGMFWSIVETRPYMRSKGKLADYLVKAGRPDEAMTHYQALLKLNPNDNQGCRYNLLPYFLERQQAKKAEVLLTQYPDDACTVWAYGRALLLFQKWGSRAFSSKALQEAMETNPYMLPYLLGIRSIPDELPEAYSFGTEEEALSFATPVLEAFEHTKGAMDWLHVQVVTFAKKTSTKASSTGLQN